MCFELHLETMPEYLPLPPELISFIAITVVLVEREERNAYDRLSRRWWRTHRRRIRWREARDRVARHGVEIYRAMLHDNSRNLVGTFSVSEFPYPLFPHKQ